MSSDDLLAFVGCSYSICLLLLLRTHRLCNAEIAMESTPAPTRAWSTVIFESELGRTISPDLDLERSDRIAFPPVNLPNLRNGSTVFWSSPSQPVNCRSDWCSLCGQSLVEWSAMRCAPHFSNYPTKTTKAKQWIWIYDLTTSSGESSDLDRPTATRPDQRPATGVGHRSDALRCDKVQGMGSETQDYLWLTITA